MTDLGSFLPPGSCILDLGCAKGSFRNERADILTVRVDREAFSPQDGSSFVQADAGVLPFAPESFDLVVCNHSLEHFRELGTVLDELRRVIKRDGLLFISVPDSTSITDRVYRWLASGGGHVNAFAAPGLLIRTIEDRTGLRHMGTKPLFSSLTFLNRRNIVSRMPGKMALFLWGSERYLAFVSYCLRILDRIFGSRYSHYGWASYFGTPPGPLLLDPWTNVCVHCGSGHPAGSLRAAGVVRTLFWKIREYTCPLCGARNLFTADDWAPRINLDGEYVRSYEDRQER
jgi:SAM-dependent methyltransferase